MPCSWSAFYHAPIHKRLDPNITFATTWKNYKGEGEKEEEELNDEEEVEEEEGKEGEQSG